MTHKFPLIVLISLLFALTTSVFADEGTKGENGKSDENGKAEKFEVSDPQNARQAQDLYNQAFDYDRKEEFDKALLCYNKLLSFYEKENKRDNNFYAMHVLNNLGILSSDQGKYKDASQYFERALTYAQKLDLHGEIAEFYHKLGILYTNIAKIEEDRKAAKNDIFPQKDPKPKAKKLYTRGVYTRLTQEGQSFVAQRIRLKSSRNPFEQIRELYTKLVNLKVKSDFDPDALIVPDTVTFLVQLHKKGYYPVVKQLSLLPEIEYSELLETMLAKPRKVEPQISEDFYLQESVPVDEISLTQMIKGQLVGKPMQVVDKEEFKPGSYQLFIQKSGYEDLRENITIYPDEGPFILRRSLRSKMRDILADIRGDFNARGTDEVTPDEISLNGRQIHSDSKVKPGEYKLAIKAEGYEPIIRTMIIEPDERKVQINEFMKSLPREVIFQINGDYQPDERLVPDEITFDGRFIRPTGESVRPKAYRIFIRKKGYEPISKRIIIDPKNEPYIVKETLVALPRRTQLKITASFPQNYPIPFPDTCTLTGKDVNTTESFRPGSYTLYIKHRGYRPVTRTIEITPDDEPYVIQQVLDPKEIQVNLNVSYDVEPQDPSIMFEVAMENERTKENTRIKDGDKILPESYLIKVERAGYEPDTQRQLLMPSDDNYMVERKLVASPRRVITHITAEYPDGEIVEPDEITLDNKPITKDFKIKPGTHDLIILKEGYLPIRKTIKILASDKDFMLSERLTTKTRLVTLEFLDSYDRRKLAPDEIYMGSEQVPANETAPLKPGEYTLRVTLKGYASIDETVTIPVGSEPYQITKFMVAIKRDILTQVTSDYTGDTIEPDIFTLNGLRIGRKGTVKPGKFNLVIQMKGYFPIFELLEIAPDPKPFMIKRQLISKPRKMEITIKSSFSGEKMTPESIMVGSEDVKDGQEIKPGNYQLTIREKGYKTLSEDANIEPSETPYIMEKTLDALPRLVKYSISNDFDGLGVDPDVITLNDDIVDQKTPFLPGKYTLKIEKRGFHPKQYEILIEPSDESYVITTQLESMEREIEAIITGDFPKDEPIDPEVIALGTRDVRENVFKPGKYELTIEQPGYVSLKKDIIIPPGEDRFLIEEVLATKARKIKTNISFDVPPAPDDSSPIKITIAPLDQPTEEKEIKDGELLKPNSYILRIMRKAYEPIEVRKHVWPDEAPVLINEELIAKQVVVFINVAHDVPAPPGLPEYNVSIIDKVNNALSYINHGKRVKPGDYDLSVHRPGYNFGAPKPISILPSEEPFQINASLVAMPRNISFDMIFEGRLVPAHEIVNAKNGKRISFEDMFEAGSSIDMIIKFKKYATVKKHTTIVPGQGPLVANVPLKKLKRYDFNVRKNEMKLDDIAYKYEFYADNENVQEHLISIEKGVGRFYYTIWVVPEAKDLRASAGYLYTQKSFSRLRLGIGSLNSISVPKLISHLNEVSKIKRGRRGSLEVMEKMLRTFVGKRRLRQCHPNELDQLVQFIEGWRRELPGAQDRIRLQVVTESLGKLRNK